MSRNTPKRNLSSPSTKDTEKKSKIFVTPNRYASLSEDADSPPEVFSPPPVKLSSQDQLNVPPANTESPSPTKVQTPPFYLIIHAGTVVVWNTIFKFLADNEQFKFHTHLPKPLKPYSVFIRHLHPSTPVEDIQAYITDKGYAVIQVTNILHRINKNALPLFRIDLKPATNNSDILNLDSMLHTKIKIELPKKNVPLLNASHAKLTFIQVTFVTITLVASNAEISSECSKPPTTPAKCALCSGPHTASYKGCPVYKNIIKNQANLKATKYNELLKHNKRSQPIQQKSNYLNPNTAPTLPPLQIPPHLPEASYASIINSNNNLSNNNFLNDNLLAKFIIELSALINLLISLLTTILQKQFTP
ncbi:hypothetical protein QTP88_011583 [Uroleucon formosanum]